MSVGISAQFKKDTREFNGLDDIIDALIEEPLTRRIIVAEIETKRITRDMADGGVETPTIKLLRIEPLDGDAAETARKLLLDAYDSRRGADRQPDLFSQQAAGEDGEPVSERTPDTWLKS